MHEKRDRNPAGCSGPPGGTQRTVQGLAQEEPTVPPICCRNTRKRCPAATPSLPVTVSVTPRPQGQEQAWWGLFLWGTGTHSGRPSQFEVDGRPQCKFQKGPDGVGSAPRSPC